MLSSELRLLGMQLLEQLLVQLLFAKHRIPIMPGARSPTYLRLHSISPSREILQFISLPIENGFL